MTRLIVGSTGMEHLVEKVNYLTKLATEMTDLKTLEDNCHKLLPKEPKEKMLGHPSVVSV